MTVIFVPVPAVARGAGWVDPTDADLAAIEADWQNLALCQQTDPDAFFPEHGASPQEAKKVCARCEVRAECRADALDRMELHGVWGGLVPEERRRLLREGRAA